MFSFSAAVTCASIGTSTRAPPAATLGVVLNASGAHLVPYNRHAPPLTAWAGYSDTISVDGWSYLSVWSNKSFPDAHQAYAAGYVEAALTHARIWEFASNKEGLSSGWSKKLAAFIEANFEFMAEQIAAHPVTTGATPSAEVAWWHQVDLMLQQLNGLRDGYRAACPPERMLSNATLLTLSLHSDMDTLCPLFGCTSVPSQHRPRVSGRGHCSAIVKLIDTDTPELYTAHTTWTGYEDMTRVYKMYDFAFTEAGGHTRLAFSSYPGNLFSTDDWYVTSHNLAVLETTIDNHNASLWQHVTPRTVMTWIRTMVANRLARDGPSWASVFSRWNSGTYNNEFHIVDYKLFDSSVAAAVARRGAAGSSVRSDAVEHTLHLLPHVLTIVDQMPGSVEVADRSEWLERIGFWASYNRPGLPATFGKANYTAMVAAHGDHFSWSHTARAQLFDKLAPSISDEASLRKVMRYNRFREDPKPIAWQACRNGPSASNAISERGDLTDLTAGCIDDIRRQDEGGIDLKYTTAALMRQGKLAAIAQSGPSFDDQPPFVWSRSPFASQPHAGQPDAWKFPYVHVEW